MDQSKKIRYVLTQDEIQQISAVAAEEGVKAYKKERDKVEKRFERDNDSVFRTKKILSSYRRMKAALADEDTLTEDEQIELRWNFLADLMGEAKSGEMKSERVIQDFEKRRHENRYSIFQLEKAAGLYRDECEKIGTDEALRRFREFEMMYLTDDIYTVQDIAEIESVSDKTVYKDIGIACKIVSAYLFGI